MNDFELGEKLGGLATGQKDMKNDLSDLKKEINELKQIVSGHDKKIYAWSAGIGTVVSIIVASIASYFTKS